MYENTQGVFLQLSRYQNCLTSILGVSKVSNKITNTKYQIHSVKIVGVFYDRKKNNNTPYKFFSININHQIPINIIKKNK